MLDGGTQSHIPHGAEKTERRPEVVLEWLRLAREFGGRWIERFGEAFFERTIRPHLSRVPLEFLRDVEWYATITQNDSLMREIQS